MSLAHRFPRFVNLMKQEGVDIDLLIERVNECIRYLATDPCAVQTENVEATPGETEYERLLFFQQLLVSVREHYYGNAPESRSWEGESPEKQKQENFEAFLRAFDSRYKNSRR